MGHVIIVVAGTTDISLIPGITVAGASPELTHYTPAADVEYLLLGRSLSLRGIPVTPDGVPSPALVTRALTRDLPRLVAFAGGRVRPKIPFVDLGGEPGGDFRKGPAMSRESVASILSNGVVLGREMARAGEVMIGETMPAGTTTAMAILVALGYDAWGRTSSAGPTNPKELKAKVVEEGLRRAGRPRDPVDVLSELGDPVHAGVAAIALGILEEGGRPILAGGTQMMAVAALIKALGGDPSKVKVATTGWVADDGSSDLLGLAKDVGVLDVEVTRVSFAESRFPGLRAYDRGYVKEGVAMGGALLLAAARGLPILKLVEEEYESALGTPVKV